MVMEPVRGGRLATLTPEANAVLNTAHPDWSIAAWALADAAKIESVGKPADCIGCGACTGHCPQNIDTPAIMAELAELL